MAEKAPTALVTGGAGFIGSHLVEALVAEGYRVRVLDDFSSGRRDNLAPVAGCIELVEGDVRDARLVAESMAAVDYVFHEAAVPSVVRSLEDPRRSHTVTVDGTLNVLEAARLTKPRRVVYASSSSVYGDTPTLPKTETMTPQPLSPYAAAKLSAEHYVRVYARVFGVPAVALRYFNVFGPRQDPTSAYTGVISIFIRELLAGRSPAIDGDGEQTRDFTYVSDAVAANLQAARADGAVGEVFNVARGEQTSINELVRLLRDLTSARVEPRYGPARSGDVRHSRADIAKARRLLGYEPRVALREGLARTVAWMREALKGAPAGR
jgi:nucleoside-diphosphate-sugar epimerase